MLKISEIAFGIRNLLLVSLCLLFISALLASLFGLAAINYPADTLTNLALWAAVVTGSFTTAKNLPPNGKSWLLGGTVGGVFGVAVSLVMLVFYSLSGSQSDPPAISFLLIILFYAVLGLVGAFVGGLASSHGRDYYLDR